MKLAFRTVIVAVTALLSAQFVRAATPVSPLPAIDFKQTYPWLVWVSSEGHDAEYPKGFRYKLLSVRSADSQSVEFVLLRELPDGSKTIALHARGPLDKFEDAVAKMLDNFAKKFGVTFQRIDLRDVHDFSGFKERANDLGWTAEANSPP